jgi:hypothetical protein
LHLQVCLLQAKEDLSLLQHPVKVDGVFRTGTRGADPGVEVMLGSLGLDALDVTFHAHSLKSTLESHKSILPRSDGAFSTIQLPLSGKELLVHLSGHRHAWRRRRPTNR